MAWFSRFTRFGDVHWVFGQEREISCGVASAIMAAFKINKLTPGVKAVFDEDTVVQKATKLFGPNPLGDGGLSNPRMVDLLNHADLKMPGWKLDTLAPSAVVDKLISIVGITHGFGVKMDVNPVVVGIDWNGGGGHWVVIDTIRALGNEMWATVCDPWDANVHIVPISRNQTLNYTAKKGQAVDLFGTHQEYTSPSSGGVFVGDLIFRK
jgi:hypothetical protein